jgi:hypothetical protein
MQRSLLNIPTAHQKGTRSRRRARRPDSRRHVSREGHSLLGLYSELEQRTSNPPAVPIQLNRLVDIAVTAQRRCGKWHLQALAIPDSAFDAADFGTRLRMVKYLQDLRLLLWLLCRKEYSRDWLLNPSGFPRSELISEARLVSSWSLSTLCIIPTRIPLAKFRYEHEYHEMDYTGFLPRRPPTKSSRASSCRQRPMPCYLHYLNLNTNGTLRTWTEDCS